MANTIDDKVSENLSPESRGVFEREQQLEQRRILAPLVMGLSLLGFVAYVGSEIFGIELGEISRYVALGAGTLTISGGEYILDKASYALGWLHNSEEYRTAVAERKELTSVNE